MSRWFVVTGVIALGLCVSAPPARAQTSRGGGQTGTGSGTGSGTVGGGTTTGGTGTGTGATTGKTTPTTSTLPRETREPQFEPRVYFLSGKVVIDDGTAPPEPVVIERVCGGVRRAEGYTDTKGRFSFQLGQNRAMMADASSNSAGSDPLTNRDSDLGGFRRTGMNSAANADVRLMGCELRAVLAGYRSDSVNLSGHRALDSPDVGTLVLHRLGNVEGTTISATSMAAPKDAKKAYEKGLGAVKKQKWPEAREQFQQAVTLYPKYAAAWCVLGEAFLQEKNVAAAREAFSKSLEADPKYLKPYRPLASLAIQEQKWQEAADTTDKLMRLDPVDFPDALLMNAIANVNLRKLDVAEKSAREAVRIDTEHQFPRAEYVLGLILAGKQDYAEALQLMRSYVGRVPNAPDAAGVRQQIVQLEKTVGAQPDASAATK